MFLFCSNPDCCQPESLLHWIEWKLVSSLVSKLAAKKIFHESKNSMKNRDLAKHMELARQATGNMSKTDFPAAVRTAAKQIQQIKAFFGPDGALGEFARQEQDRKKVEQAGWLPHSIIPIDVVRVYAKGGSDLSSGITEYFRYNWPTVKQYFEERLQTIDISDESKETFLEALECHSHGFYRASIRLLFPQIEQEVSIGFKPAVKKSKSKVKNFINTVKTAPVGYAIDKLSDISLFDKLSDHMYLTVDEDNMLRFKNDMVPNRHASLHGIIIYSTLQHSVNTIIMADYVFRIVSNLKNTDVTT